MRFTTPITIIIFLIATQVAGQNTNLKSSPELDVFQQAKVYAFEEENYTKALNYISEVIIDQPKNRELQLFKSRLLFWGMQHNNALVNIIEFLDENPLNLDAHNLLIDIYESQCLYDHAIEKCHAALYLIPDNLQLLFRLAYNQSQNEEYSEASKNCLFILEKDPHHKKAINLHKSIKSKLQQNFVVAEYRYFFLDTPEQSLNFYNIQYARKIKGTTLIGIANMAKSYNDKGFQYNLEMYNDLGKKYYSYLHVGYSNSILLPELRMNAAIYKAMAYRMEGSIFLTIMKTDDQLIRVVSPSFTKNIGNSAFSITGNVINKSYDNELTYRARFRQYISNHTNFVGIAVGSFSRDETLGQRTEQELAAKYVSYQAQINLGLDVIFGINYNRSITKKATARDQLSTYLKHNF